MQKLSSLLGRLAVIAAGALALGACNRAEYAMLPRSASYLGTKTVASTSRPASSVAARPEVAPVAPAAEVTTPATVAAPAAEVSTPAASAVAVAAPAAKPTVSVRSEPTPAAPVATASTPAPVKLNLVQRLALHKITKKMDKLAAKAPQFKQRDAAASTSRLDGGLRTAIVVLLISLLVGILASIGGTVGTLFAILASILFVIGIVLLILYLLDQA